MSGGKTAEMAVRRAKGGERKTGGMEHGVANVEQRAREKRIPVLEISAKESEMLSDTVTSQGIFGVVNVTERKLEEVWALPAGSLVVALERVSDPGNVGTIIRTCDWFGVDAVLLDKNTVELTNSKVTRATMGSMFHFPIYSEVDLSDILPQAKKRGFTIYATSPVETKNFPKSFAGKSFLIFGSEAQGVSPDVLREADKMVSIPKFGSAESLNVAISCGVLLGLWRLS